MAPSLKARARVMGEEVGGYSADRYRSWASVAYALLKLGLDEREAEAVMRSKHTRWAADQDDKHRYGYHPGHIVADYLTEVYLTPEAMAQEILELVWGTFTDEKGHVTPDDFTNLVARLKAAKEAK